MIIDSWETRGASVSTSCAQSVRVSTTFLKSDSSTSLLTWRVWSEETHTNSGHLVNNVGADFESGAWRINDSIISWTLASFPSQCRKVSVSLFDWLMIIHLTSWRCWQFVFLLGLLLFSFFITNQFDVFKNIVNVKHYLSSEWWSIKNHPLMFRIREYAKKCQCDLYECFDILD